MRRVIPIITLFFTLTLSGCMEEQMRKAFMMPKEVFCIIEGAFDISEASFKNDFDKELTLEEEFLKLDGRVGMVSRGRLFLERGERSGQFKLYIDRDVDINELKWLMTTSVELKFMAVPPIENSDFQTKFKRYLEDGMAIYQPETEKFSEEFSALFSAETTPYFYGKFDNGLIKDSSKLPLLLTKGGAFDTTPEIEEVSVFDNSGGGMRIGFKFAKDFKKGWAQFTGANIGYKAAIVVNDLIVSAPVIQDKIPGGECQITLPRATVDDAFIIAKFLKMKPLKFELLIDSETYIAAPDSNE